MDKSLFAIILISISSFFISNELFLDAKVYESISEELCDIHEYGMKVEYLTDNNEKELDRYKEIFDDINPIYYENTISLEKSLDDKSIALNIIKENDLSRVSMEIISESYINLEEIKNSFDNINKEIKGEIEYYTYIKGDIRENKSDEDIEKYLLDIFENNGKAEIQKMILDKGTTGIINFKSDYQFNYSIMTYEEDRVLILGSPIIFTTY